MIKPISNQADWNNFLLQLHPNTFLQSWQWGQVQKVTGEDVLYLGLFSADRQIGSALVVLVNARRGRHWLIPHGPLFADDRQAPILLPEIISYLTHQPRGGGLCALRIAPLLTNTPAAERLFTGLGFRPAPLHVHAELTWLLNIDQPDQVILSGMRKTTRHAIRRAAQAGVQCRLVTEPRQAAALFWPLYRQTQHRHGFVTWSRTMITAQLELFGQTDSVYAIFARYQNKDIAAAIIPTFGTTAFYYHGASLKLPASIPAAQLVQWTAIQEAKRRGLSRYNFWGIAPDRQPDHPFAGLTTFKKGFGGYAVNYLHAHDLPLSPRYWQLWLVDSVRRIKRGF